MSQTLRRLLDEAYDAWLRVDGAGRVLGWSQQGAGLFGTGHALRPGVALAELLGTADCLPPAAAQERQEPPLRNRWELPWGRPGGRPGFLELTWIEEQEGQWLLLVNDISSQRLAEHSLNAAFADLNATVAELAFYRSALDAALIVSVADAWGLIIEVNDHYCAATGYQREEVVRCGRMLLDLFDQSADELRRLWATISVGKVWSGELKERRCDGSIFWVDCSIVPFQERGRPDRFLALRSDVTARKVAEAALLRSQQELAEAQRIARMGRWEWRIRERVVSWSPEAAEIFGSQPSGDASGDIKRFLAGVYPADRARVHSRVREALTGGADCRIDFRILPPDGGLRHVHVQAIVKRDGRGKPLRMVGTVLDITDRKRVEEALEQAVAEQRRLNEQLKAAQDQLLQSEKLASIGQLAAGVAHEINNPVGYVSSNLSTMTQYVGDLLALLDAYGACEGALPAAEQERLAERKRAMDLEYVRADLPDLLADSREGVARVRQIVQDLKDFSHVDEGEWQQEDLARGLDSTLNIVHNELKYKATVVKEYADLPVVECLGAQLNQVFMNLLVNAGHAIREKGTITIRTGMLPPEHVFVEVSDTGCGIPRESLSRIFDPFFTTKPVGQGTGLGLSLAYSIVKKHNGRIEVTSEPGHGSTFRVVIPVRRAGPEALAS